MSDFDDLLVVDDMPRAAPAMGSTAHVADMLGLTTRMVTELAQRGLLVKAGRGLWDVRESVRTYTAHLREQAAGRGSTATLTTERLRVVKAQAEAAEMKNAVARGEMVPARDVKAEWSNVLRDVRSALLAVASRAGSKLPHLTTHDVAQIDAEIRTALEGMSNAK